MLNVAQDPTIHQRWPYNLTPLFVFIVRKPKYTETVEGSSIVRFRYNRRGSVDDHKGQQYTSGLNFRS